MTTNYLTVYTTKELKRQLKTYRELLPKDLYSTKTSELVQEIEAELKRRGDKGDKQTPL